MVDQGKNAALDADFLVKELRDEFDSGKTRSYQWRIDQLKGISKMIKERENDVVQALQIDLSKPRFETYVTEISTLKTSCELAIRKLKCWMKPKKVNASLITFPSSASIVSEPLGLVLVISTWNYPFLLSLDPVIGAIAAGNAVVLKPSEVAPATSSLLAKLLQCYVDSSCIRVVEGSVAETCALLDQKWDKIFYTGSGRIGRVVMAAASRHLTPVVLELGGKCPTVVDSNIDLNLAAKRIVAGKWGCNSGQTCISPDYIITTRDVAPKLIDAIKLALERSYGKDLLKCQEMSRIVNQSGSSESNICVHVSYSYWRHIWCYIPNFRGSKLIVNMQHFTRLVKLVDEEGVSSKIVMGGQSDEKQLKIAPTILLDVPENSVLMNEEIFGPLLPIVTVDNIEESFRVIKSKPKPLAAYLFTNNKKMKEEFINNISAGGVMINDTVLHFTLNSMPFGGVGASGVGCYHGKFSFDAFSHQKAVLSKSFFLDVSVRYPPYTLAKVKTFQGLSSSNVVHKVFGLVRVCKDFVVKS